MICPLCRDSNQKSKVRKLGDNFAQADEYWDEDGHAHYHVPDGFVKADYRCSNGHDFQLAEPLACVGVGCSFGKVVTPPVMVPPMLVPPVV